MGSGESFLYAFNIPHRHDCIYSLWLLVGGAICGTTNGCGLYTDVVKVVNN